MDDGLNCSFCGKHQNDVNKLIEGPDVYICDGCIDLCHDLLHEPGTPQTPVIAGHLPEPPLPTPREIKEFLDRYVIGQDPAKEIIAVAVRNHYKRLAAEPDNVEIEKSNLLLIGPTGSGKTYLARTIARCLRVPFAMSDATSITEAGYVGEDVESIIGRLLAAANQDVRLAQRGIVFIDEIDKRKKQTLGNGGTGRDVSGEGVQQALLKILEGTDLAVPLNGKRNATSEIVMIDTRNILFILGGAFAGLDKIINDSDHARGIGFGANVENAVAVTNVKSDHLVSFGMIPELIGRVPIVTTLAELTEADLCRILVEPENAIIKQFQKLFAMDKVTLVFDDAALHAIAKQAYQTKTGGRGLRSILENVLSRIQFELPDLQKQGLTRVTITEACVVHHIMPILTFGDGEVTI